MFEMKKSDNPLENELFKSFLNNYEFPLKRVEFIIRQECNQKCDYCYIT